MKKILILTLEFPPQIGGIATSLHALATALDPARVVVVAPPLAGAAEWDRTQPYKIIRRPLLWPRLIWPRWGRAFFAVLRIVKQEKIELIMIHHALPLGYVGFFLSHWRRIPYLLWFHGTDIAFSLRNSWKRFLLSVVAGRAGQIIFISNFLRARLLAALPVLDQKSLVLYPCPDAGFFVLPNPTKLTLLRSTYALHGKQILLSIGRLTDGKGFPHLLRLLPDIIKQVPNLIWLVVGDGPKQEGLVRQMEKAKLQAHIHFVGSVAHEQLRLFYGAANVFALLTHPDEGREEGLGLVFLEAAAAGLPVVAGRSGGVEEAVMHTKTGLVVDVANPRDVVEAITFLFTNTAYADELGRYARERVKAEFQWEHQIKKLDPWLV